MTKNDLIKNVGAVLGTLAETGGSPAGLIYTALGMDMHAWETTRDVMVGSDLITIDRAHYVTPTPKGIELGKKVNTLLNATAAARARIAS